MQGAQVQICDAWSENKITHTTEHAQKIKKKKKKVTSKSRWYE